MYQIAEANGALFLKCTVGQILVGISFKPSKTLLKFVLNLGQQQCNVENANHSICITTSTLSFQLTIFK